MVNTAVPGRRGGQTVALEPKEHAFYELIEEVADSSRPIREVLAEIRDVLREILEQQKSTNQLLERSR
ncbi:MAG TPA: hypothetical protein VF494_07330 [Candidatus Limnocylindrales bacterium]